MIIAVDIGTSSLKVGLVDPSGRIVKSYVQDIPLNMPQSFAAEHSLEFIWGKVREGIEKVSRGYESKVEAVALSSYLHGLGVLDKNFNVVVNIMTHLDKRCFPEQELIEKHGYELYARTGCPPLFVFPLCKARWLRKAGMLRREHRVTFVKDYVTYRLSGLHAIDYGVASGTGLLNIHELKWDSKALEIAELDESMLPELYEGSIILDYITMSDLGLEKVALVLGSFDGALQNIGYSVYENEAVINLGSTAVIRLLSTKYAVDMNPEMRFFTYYAAEGYRAIGGASNNGMIVIDWLKNLLGTGELEVIDRAVCKDGVFVLPFLAGERYPFRDPNLTLTVTGLRLEHRREHVFRGSIEGIGFTLKYILKALEENNVTIGSLHCAGGGCQNRALVQILANVLCKPIAIHRDPRNAVVLGATATALKALGYLKTIREATLEASLVESYVYPSTELCEDYVNCFEKFLHLVKTVKKNFPR